MVAPARPTRPGARPADAGARLKPAGRGRAQRRTSGENRPVGILPELLHMSNDSPMVSRRIPSGIDGLFTE
jgi:hypothetical protein